MNRLTPAENNRRMEMYKQGMAVWEIAEAIPLSIRGVYSWLKANDLSPNHKQRRRYNTKPADSSWVAKRPEWERRLVRRFITDIINISLEFKLNHQALTRIMRVWVQNRGGIV